LGEVIEAACFGAENERYTTPIGDHGAEVIPAVLVGFEKDDFLLPRLIHINIHRGGRKEFLLTADTRGHAQTAV